MTDADVHAAEYEQRRKQNKNTKTVEKSTITNVLNNVEGLAKSSFGGVKNVVKTVSDSVSNSLDPNRVSWWRVKDVSAVESPGQSIETFGLRKSLEQRVTERAKANAARVRPKKGNHPSGISIHRGARER